MFVRYWRAKGCEALQNSKYFSYGIPVRDDNQNILFCTFKKRFSREPIWKSKKPHTLFDLFCFDIHGEAGNSFKKTTSILF